MTIVEHLEELRRRLLYGLTGLVLATALGLWQQQRMLVLLMRPAGITHLVALTVLEPLLVKFKVGLVFGAVLTFPWLLLQALLFVAPGLTARETRYIVPVTALSLVLAAVGVHGDHRPRRRDHAGLEPRDDAPGRRGDGRALRAQPAAGAVGLPHPVTTA